MIEAFPLDWPLGHARTRNKERARFKTTFASARDSIMSEIRRLGGKDIIISTNIPVRGDGLPYATYKKPSDPGVGVYFILKGEQFVFACDRWDSIENNMQAINKTIEAIRGMDRWGCSDMLKRAFTGFKALPPGAGNTEPSRPHQTWWEVLEVKETATMDEIKSSYRNLVKIYHPDNAISGNQADFEIIQDAYEQICKLRGV